MCVKLRRYGLDYASCTSKSLVILIASSGCVCPNLSRRMRTSCRRARLSIPAACPTDPLPRCAEAVSSNRSLATGERECYTHTAQEEGRERGRERSDLDQALRKGLQEAFFEANQGRKNKNRAVFFISLACPRQWARKGSGTGCAPLVPKRGVITYTSFIAAKDLL